MMSARPPRGAAGASRQALLRRGNVPLGVIAMLGIASIAAQRVAGAETTLPGTPCNALPQASIAWPEGGIKVLSAAPRAAGAMPAPFAPPGVTVAVAEHCDVIGVMHERQGADGQHYAIHFHVRLPASWNGRLLFQGGGGTDGNLGDAIGFTGMLTPPAITQGYAVVSQDAGHDNVVNQIAGRGGDASFGFDPQARADYGYASLRPVARAAKALVAAFYGRGPQRAYFMGCSKGGAEGLQFAQRDPGEFDGILASAPALSLPRAAVAQAFDTQVFTAALPQPPDMRQQPFSPLAAAFSPADLQLVAGAILAVCDRDDGAADGLVGDFERCTSARVQPALQQLRCRDGKTDSCLTAAQITALRRTHQGPRNRAGQSLYAEFPWDAGIAGPGWALWKLGAPSGKPIALNITLGAGALAAIFTTPPTALSTDPQAQYQYQLRFDLERDAPKIYTTAKPFSESAWSSMAARATNLEAFRSHGGRLLIPQGTSDPVFSINDTIAWWRAVDRRSAGRAAAFVRVFPVPGMAHCASGPATDGYDGLGALVDWVEQGRAPDRILAHAGPATPWPGRTRPLCPYPAIARYDGKGDLQMASSFACEVAPR